MWQDCQKVFANFRKNFSIERPEMHMEPWIFFEKKISKMLLWRSRTQFWQVGKKSIARVQILVASNPNLFWNRNSKQNKKNFHSKNLKTRWMQFWQTYRKRSPWSPENSLAKFKKVMNGTIFFKEKMFSLTRTTENTERRCDKAVEKG